MVEESGPKSAPFRQVAANPDARSRPTISSARSEKPLPSKKANQTRKASPQRDMKKNEDVLAAAETRLSQVSI